MHLPARARVLGAREVLQRLRHILIEQRRGRALAVALAADLALASLCTDIGIIELVVGVD